MGGFFIIFIGSFYYKFFKFCNFLYGHSWTIFKTIIVKNKKLLK
jgi:hypothetical protein